MQRKRKSDVHWQASAPALHSRLSAPLAASLVVRFSGAYARADDFQRFLSPRVDLKVTAAGDAPIQSRCLLVSQPTFWKLRFAGLPINRVSRREIGW